MDKYTDSRPLTRSEQAAEELIGLIRKKNYAPGDKLPTETELSEILQAGRNTVREALRILVSRNIVVIRQGSGIFLSEKQGVADDPFGFSLAGNHEKLTRDLIQIRLMLEPPIAALAAQNATKEDLQKLEDLLLEVETLIARRADYAKADIRFHEQIANCSHNSVMSNLVPGKWKAPNMNRLCCPTGPFSKRLRKDVAWMRSRLCIFISYIMKTVILKAKIILQKGRR